MGFPRVLAEHGYVDDAWQIFVQRSQPGYQWWFDQGEDTLWETFDAGASHNHIMFGDVSAWAYEYIAGIRILEPGFAKIAFRPHAPKGVERFEARHRTPRGEIRAGWRRGPDGKPSSSVMRRRESKSSGVGIEADDGGSVAEAMKPTAIFETIDVSF